MGPALNITVSKVTSYIDGMKHPLITLLVVGLIIRFVLAPLLTFNIDMGYWTHVIGVFENGFGLYGTAGYYYTPIWGYILGGVMFFNDMINMADMGTFLDPLASMINDEFKVSDFVTSLSFNVSVKIPLIITDIVTGVLIYKLVERWTGSQTKSALAFLLWFLSPLVITESAVHGTFDNFSVMFTLLAIMFCLDRKYIIAGAAFSVAVFTKFFPIFFIFFLVALVLKQEGIDKKGAKNLLKAIVGFVAASVVIYLPNIIRGEFWESLYFLAYRMGISRETLASIGTVKTIVILSAAVVVIAAVLWIISKYGNDIVNSLKDKKKTVAKVLAIAAALLIIAYAFKLVISLIIGDMSSFESIGMALVTMVTIFSVFLELYLAYRLLIIDEPTDNQIITIMMLSALAILLWPTAPSYVLILFPFVIIYACCVDVKYVKPAFAISVFVALGEITAYVVSMSSLSVYTGWIDVSVIIGGFEFLLNPSALIVPGSWILDAPVVVLSYLSVIYVSYKWYKAYFRGDRQ